MCKKPFQAILGLAVSFLIWQVPFASPAAGSAPQPSICTRGCWGATAPSGTISQMSALNRAIVHHTAGHEFNTSGYEASKANVRAIQSYHKNTNGWGDIGYHFLVDKFGYTFEGRHGSMSSRPRGAHDGTNSNSFGFNLMGWFHPHVNNVPTPAMMRALYDVIAWRMPNGWQPFGSPGTYGPLGNQVGYVDAHRRVKATACPGDAVFHPYMGSNMNSGTIRSEIQNRINGTTGIGGNRKKVVRVPNGGGYWIAAADGGVFSYGNAPFYGSMGGQPLNQPVVAMAARPQGNGYWLASADGGVFCFGAAGFYGSMGGIPLAQPVVDICATASGNGYWMVAKDGGIFSFGDAPYHGSVPGVGININNVIGMASTPSNGYWIVASDGGVFSFGAPFHGSAGGAGFNDFTGIAARSTGAGYWLLRNNGAIYTYGSMNYAGGVNQPGQFKSIAAGPSTYNGYWLMKHDGAIFTFGDAPFYGGAN